MTCRRMPAIAVAFAALAVSAAPAAAQSGASCGGTDAIPSAANIDRVRSATLCLLNAERAKRGLPALRTDGALRGVAGRFAQQMVRQRFFDHVSPAGSTMVGRIKGTAYARGARSWSLAENIAWGAGSESSPAAIVDVWMHSAEHRANILDGDLRDIGIGISTGTPRGGDGATYVSDFGARSR
jgi:uncharacterized protein YkwD